MYLNILCRKRSVTETARTQDSGCRCAPAGHTLALRSEVLSFPPSLLPLPSVADATCPRRRASRRCASRSLPVPSKSKTRLPCRQRNLRWSQQPRRPRLSWGFPSPFPPCPASPGGSPRGPASCSTAAYCGEPVLCFRRIGVNVVEAPCDFALFTFPSGLSAGAGQRPRCAGRRVTSAPAALQPRGRSSVQSCRTCAGGLCPGKAGEHCLLVSESVSFPIIPGFADVLPTSARG